MRFPWVLLAACSYSPSAGTVDSDGPRSDGPVSDGPATDTAIDTSSDSMAAGGCDTGNPELRLCFDFDGDVVDRSGQNNQPNIVTGVSFTTGVSGQAAVTTGSRIEVPADNSLDVTDLTLRVSIKPTALPAINEKRQGLLENDSWRLLVQPGGGIRCAINSGTPEVIVAVPVTAGVFTRVACTFDGQTMQVFYNGVVMGTTTLAAQVTTVDLETTIGQTQPADPTEVFNGAMDQLEVWSSLETP